VATALYGIKESSGARSHHQKRTKWASEWLCGALPTALTLELRSAIMRSGQDIYAQGELGQARSTSGERLIHVLGPKDRHAVGMARRLSYDQTRPYRWWRRRGEDDPGAGRSPVKHYDRYKNFFKRGKEYNKQILPNGYTERFDATSGFWGMSYQNRYYSAEYVCERQHLV